MDIWDLYNLIGKNLKKFRKDNNITQEQLAEDLNMSRSYISQIEALGVKTGVSLDTLFLIANTYNFDIRKFFDGYELLVSKKNVL